MRTPLHIILQHRQGSDGPRPTSRTWDLQLYLKCAAESLEATNHFLVKIWIEYSGVVKCARLIICKQLDHRVE
ncbi:Uncharacterized protein HZ326_20952 [Fusarium oxysporum f. sp. albedinis]|nr:Uncharacterized protein HZ326_20952 [Fusarium oxysporum f. sp. albedinis]